MTGPGGAVRLEPKVMQVLVCLAERPGDVVAKERLMRSVWPDAFVGDDVLTRCISELRRVFGDDAKEPRVIQTIPKTGYRLIARVSNGAEEKEKLQGDTLAARIQKGPVPVAEALRIGIEIAEALDAAHAQGIVHGDLKPGNVMLTASGTKLLDFVLPEQLEGKDVDARTDIFAFGAVLYEMITARKDFKEEEQPLSPPSLERVVRTCLEKDHDKRWSSIHDVLLQLQWIAQEKPTAVTAGDSKPQRGNGLPWLIAAAAIVLAATALLWSIGGPQAPHASTHVLSIVPPFGTTFATEEPPVVSPDGARLAFVAHDASGRRLLHIQALNSYSDARPLANTDGASMPFWKPDSGELGFFGQGKLKTVAISSGQVRTLAPASGARGGAWNNNDVIVFVPAPGGIPYRISASGADLTPIKVEGTGWYPSFLPDGRHFLLFEPSNPQPDQAVVQLTSLDAMPPARIVPAKSNAIYVAPGYLLFWRDGTLWAQPFDAERRQASGNPVALSGVVGLNPLINQALFSVSNQGTLAFYGGAAVQMQIAWFDRSGRRVGTPGPTGTFNSLSLSPDDGSVVYDEADPRTGRIDLQRFEFARGVPSRLTFHPSHDMFPVWSDDGGRVAFNSLRELPPHLYEVRPENPGNDRALLKAPAPKWPQGYSRDGSLLIYGSANPKTGSDIWALPLDGKSQPYPVLADPADERYGQLSPDGRWLAYVSNESQAYQVYVQSFPISGTKQQISIPSGGGFEPLWSRDGKELFYLSADNTLMAVDVTSSATTFDAGPPKPLFQTRIRLLEIQAGARHYGVSRDGKHFLVANATDEARSTPITVVLNWMTALGK